MKMITTIAAMATPARMASNVIACSVVPRIMHSKILGESMLHANYWIALESSYDSGDDGNCV